METNIKLLVLRKKYIRLELTVWTEGHGRSEVKKLS